MSKCAFFTPREEEKSAACCFFAQDKKRRQELERRLRWTPADAESPGRRRNKYQYPERQVPVVRDRRERGTSGREERREKKLGEDKYTKRGGGEVEK